MKKLLPILLSVLLALFSLTACGSGSGGGGGGKGGFKADYRAVSFGGAEVPAADSYKSSLLNVDVPGTAITNSTSGTAKIKEMESSSGVNESGSATLTVDSYGLMNISPTDGDPIFGGATPDASVMFGIEPVQVINDEWVSLIVGVKRSSGMSDADGVGPYFCAHIEHASPDVVLDIVDLTLDGSGGYTSSTVGTGTYSVASDGSLTITPNGLAFSLHGIARNDGEVFVVHFYDELGIGPEGGALICVKDAGSHTTDDLQGNFRAGVLSTYPGESPYGMLWDFFFDGSAFGSISLVADELGLLDEPYSEPVLYGVDGSGYLSLGGELPIFITPSKDFMIAVGDNNGGIDGGLLLVATKSTPLGFPTEYLGVTIGGDAIANISESILSINGMGNSIAPGQSGTLGIKSIIDTYGSAVSITAPFIVNSAGFINIPSTQPAWGFVNTTAKTFLLATTDQTSDNYVNLVPGVMAGSGLTNTTATMSGIYNCAAINSTGADPSLDLEFPGDGEVSFAGLPSFYGLTDKGLFSLYGNAFGMGMVQADTKMVTFLEDNYGMSICLKQPTSLSFDGFAGTYVYGTFHTETGGTPDVSAVIGSVTITNSTDLLGEVTPMTLYNSTGFVDPPDVGDPAALFLNTTTHSFELGGAGGLQVWVSDDYNLFVFSQNAGPSNELIFGIRK